MCSIGEKNRNLWNIKDLGEQQWLGQIGKDNKGHVIFLNETYGCRAAIKNLKNYIVKKKHNTLNKIFAVYAPADDTQGSIEGGEPNQPNAYAAFVAGKASIGVDDTPNLFSNDGKVKNPELLKKILLAMAIYENGARFKMPDGLLDLGLDLYAEMP